MFSQSALKNVKSLKQTALLSADYLWDFNRHKHRGQILSLLNGSYPELIQKTRTYPEFERTKKNDHTPPISLCQDHSETVKFRE